MFPPFKGLLFCLFSVLRLWQLAYVPTIQSSPVLSSFSIEVVTASIFPTIQSTPVLSIFCIEVVTAGIFSHHSKVSCFVYFLYWGCDSWHISPPFKGLLFCLFSVLRLWQLAYFPTIQSSPVLSIFSIEVVTAGIFPHPSRFSCFAYFQYWWLGRPQWTRCPYDCLWRPPSFQRQLGGTL